MISISSRYDVILTYSPIVEITGHLFECFDYYLFFRDHGMKAGVLLLGSLAKDQLKVAWESKYVDSFDEAYEDFICISKDIAFSHNEKIISFSKNTTVILCDGNIKSLDYYKTTLATTKLFGFLCEYDEFEKYSRNKNITYLMDYRVYCGKLRFFNSIDYVKKLPFKHYKKFMSPNQNIGMMYVTYVCRMTSPETILQYHELSHCSYTMLVVPYEKPEFNGLPNIQQVVAPIEDLFAKFDTYIYTPVGRHFDCSPRLVTECFMQKKNVYCSVGYFDPGLQVRYNDCLSNLNSLNLTDGDAIIDIIEKEIRK